MKLNVAKCAFDVNAGKFMGFMVTQRGIEVNPDQIRVVMETPTLNNKKEFQSCHALKSGLYSLLLLSQPTRLNISRLHFLLYIS